ncbi:C1 family peptidase [Cytophagaceae bacterium YF14B1]|uniref:C1 family peptidase n=1 Tax=Xanthocytophaga flava TaxID=3048013 RepID=A0AAE3U8V6_9BACT|nr:C1 family peptidase [Xanthocytophaga flavus]MDJ1483856.1 C1 family peptidase [Xanthocytophaga flavus]
MADSTPKPTPDQILDVRPDTLDFRDKMYEANLYEVPTKISLDEYKQWNIPILDQGKEGACTGFGLATVANYLLRRRKIVPDPKSVSPRMLYEMAKRYDEWPGEQYAGSSARGAMKGWYKHGVCSDECWPYKKEETEFRLTDERTSDALRRPLGAYYRVNHKDLVAMHAAMAEVGILYATAKVHSGWREVDTTTGIISYEDVFPIGGHAFAIVAYDEKGFWIQNSWGEDWGQKGFGLITYDDWMENGTDVWVARLGAPVILKKALSTAISHSAAAGTSEAYSYADLRPHIISLGNNGLLNPGGNFGTSEAEVKAIFEDDFPRVTAKWAKKRLLLYAHGGLVSESGAVQRLADYRPSLLEKEIYPVSFIWHTDIWSTITNILKDALQQRKPEGWLDSAKDFMLDRLDDALEPLARTLTGKAQWKEMKENALLATTQTKGGAYLALEHIKHLADKYGEDFEIHLVGHSAGSIFHAPIIRLLTSKGKINSGPMRGQTGYGLKIASCTLWAPACTIDVFKENYLPAIKNKTVNRFALFTLTDQVEQDDHCANIYHKSLLYLVSNALEDKMHIPWFLKDKESGTPLLGMEKWIQQDTDLQELIAQKKIYWIVSPNTDSNNLPNHSTARAHGAFDDDLPTVNATLARILGQTELHGEKLIINRSASSLQEKRIKLFQQS